MTRNCPDNTVDSNITGLAIAEEVCPGVLPNVDDDGFLPTWYEQEPNTYPSDFGGKLKTVARAPIKRNRQQSKGTTVGLDVTAGFNADYTMSNMLRLEQGFFFADLREKVTTSPMNSAAAVLTEVVSGSSEITGTGFVGFLPEMLVGIRGSAHNDGLQALASASATVLTVVGSLAVDEDLSVTDAVISHVGEQFASGDVQVEVTGAVGTLHNTTTVAKATGTFTIATGQNAADGETVTIGETVYTWRNAPAAAHEVLIGGALANSALNLAASINGAVTLNGPDPLVVATNGGAGVVDLTAIVGGTSGNSIVTTEAGAHTSFAAGTLSGGTGHSFLALGMIPGEWGFLGGDAVGDHFANNTGYFRVGTITDTDIVMDRTSGDVVAEAAGSLTIQIFIGDLIQNENDPDLIVKRSYQAQRTLGKDSVGTQSQYIVGMVANTMKLTVPLEDKLTVDLAFIAQSEEFRTGTQGLKDGSLVAAPGEDAINSSNDIYEMAMTVIDGADSNPTKLFGFLSAADITIDNNVTSVKGIGKLGGIGDNVGLFAVSGTATAYFTDVAANIAITDNADVDCHFISAKLNEGWVFDIALLSLGTAGIVIKSNDPITLPLTTNAAQGEHGSTLTKTSFHYLPDVAMPEQDAL